MKKLLLSFLCLLSVAITSLAADEVVATLQFGSDYNSGKISSYSNNWTATVNGTTWDVVNFNNNNSQWNYVKCGTNATITNQEPFSDPINKVALTIDAITTGSVTSIKLYVSTDSSFPEGCDTYDFNKATETQIVEITNPTPKAYYKIEFNTTATKAVTLSKVQYYKNASAVVITGLKDSYTLEVGKTKNLAAEMTISPATANVTYEIEPATGLTIEDGVMTAVTPGTYKVTATATAEGQDTTTKEFTVTVNKKTAKMHFADQIVWGKLGVGVVWQKVIVDSEDAKGVITYSTSDAENLVIDAETGQIWSDELAVANDKDPGVKAAGEYVVTATMAANGDYGESKATYRVIIIEQDAVIVDNGFDKFDFTKEGAYGLTTIEDGTKFEKGDSEVTEIDANKQDALDVVSISFVTNKDEEGKYIGNGYRLWKNGSNVDLRIYTGTDMIFEVPDGYTISQIGLVGTTGGSFSPAEGGTHTAIPDLETQPNVSSHWHAGATQKLKKVTFTPNKTNQLTEIYVLYEADNSSLKPANLSFEQTYYPIYAGEVITLPAVENPHNVPVTYTIQNLAENSWAIHPSADGKTIEVLVDETGSYTLEAYSEQTEEYRSGYAILRLNAYNHLDVHVTNGVDNIPIQKTEDGEEYFFVNQVGDDTYYVTMDVPEDAELWFRVIMPEYGDFYDMMEQIMPMSDNSDNPKAKNKDGFRSYSAYNNTIMLMDGAYGDIDFYIESYGYRSPVRTIGINPKYPAWFLLSAVGFEDDGPTGEMLTDTPLTHVYEDHSVKNSETHTFNLNELVAKNLRVAYGMEEDDTEIDDLLCLIPAPGMINFKAEPMFTPLTEDDLASYDKDNTDLIYEEPTFEIDQITVGDQNRAVVYMTCKHAGLYKVTATLGKYTFKPGHQFVGYVQVTPNMTVSDSQEHSDIYFHGIDLKNAGNGVFTLNISEDNPKGHIHYIYTGHPTYGGDNGLWYQLHYDNGGTTIPGRAPQFAATPDDEKWIKADGGFDLVNEEGKAPSDIHLKLVTNGVTKVQSYAVGGITTKVEGIESMGEDEVIYVDLNGNRVAEPSNGIFVRICGGKADKVIVK